MTTGVLLTPPILQFFDNQGNPAVGGSVLTQVGGALAATYSDVGLTTPLPNPIPLNSRGEVSVSGGASSQCFLTPNVVYTFTLYDAGMNQLWVATYVNGVQLNQSTIGQAIWPQSAAEISAGVTPTNYGFQWGDVRRYGGIGNGVAIDTAAFQAAVNCNSVVIVPNGTWLIANVAVANDNVTILGQGWTAILQVASNNSTLFTVTGQNFAIKECLWQGDGTSSSSQNGCGVFLNGAGGAIFEHNYSTGFGFGAISGVAASALAGPKILRHKCRLTAAGGNEFYLGGIWVDTVIQNPDCYSATADRCLLLYDNGTTGWVGLTVTGGGALGYLKQQWGTTDENWDGSLRVQGVLFDGLRCSGSNWSAIKCKTSRDVKIVNCKIDNCGIQQEDQANGLYGDILCNSLGRVTIQGNQIRNSGSAAIRCNTALVSQYPSSNPGGLAINEWIIDNNMIDTVGVTVSGNGYGIVLSDGMKQVSVTNNTMRGITTNGILALQQSLYPFFDYKIEGNSIVDSAAMTGAAISVGFGQSLRMDTNLIQNCGNTGVIITDVQEIHIGPTDTVLDAAVTGGYGYQIGNYQTLVIKARAGNSTYNQWQALTPYTVGTRVYNGANVYECVQGGTSGNTGGPANTAGATTEGTVVWYFTGKYQLLSYAVRIVGSANGKTTIDMDPAGVNTAPIAALATIGAGGTSVHYKASIQTTNNSATNLPVIPLPDLSAWTMKVKATANDATTPNRASYEIVGLFYRNGGGTTQEGANTNVVTIESGGAAAWDCKPVATGNNIAAQVTGATGKTINWAVDIDLAGMP